MERLRKLVDTLNSYEKSILSKEESFLAHRDSVLATLTKSKRFGNVYNYIKENRLQLNHLLLPYKLYKDKDDKKIYELKTKYEFEKDYKYAMCLIEEKYGRDAITKEAYYFLKNNVKEMKKVFAEEFCKTELDRLMMKERMEYEIILLELNKKFKEYLKYIGEEEYKNRCSQYDEAQIYQKNLFLLKQSGELKLLFGLINVDVLFVNNTFNSEENSVRKNSYNMDNSEIGYYSYDILTWEQLYKLKCVELLRKGKNINLIPVLLEENNFKKSDFSKNIKKSPNKR